MGAALAIVPEAGQPMGVVRAAPTYLTPKEVSARWDGHITVKTLANWRCDPSAKGPRFCRRGNKILYLVADLEVWEAATFATTTHGGYRKPPA
jgi:hypothetical protein